MTDTERVTPKILHKLLRYEPETGKLFWRERSDELSKNPSIRKSWNARYAGCPSPPHHKQRRRMMQRIAWRIDDTQTVEINDKGTILVRDGDDIAYVNNVEGLVQALIEANASAGNDGIDISGQGYTYGDPQ